MTWASCIYEGELTHRRHRHPARALRHRLFMMYLALEELPDLFDGFPLWSARRPSVAWFRRKDHYGESSVPLEDAIRDVVAHARGHSFSGPVRLLTHLRYFGYGFNPVSFYYCWDRGDENPQTIVAEVNNTPWNERQMYVIPGASSGVTRYSTAKTFHVSPFLGMDLDYEWVFHTPGATLLAEVHVRRDAEAVLDARLQLRRRPIDGRELSRLLIKKPLMTLQIVHAIYSEALRLWLRGASFYPHPNATGHRTNARST